MKIGLSFPKKKCTPQTLFRFEHFGNNVISAVVGRIVLSKKTAIKMKSLNIIANSLIRGIVGNSQRIIRAQ